MPRGYLPVKPKQITQWVQTYASGLSASASGKRLALIKSASQSQVYVGELSVGGTLLKPPRLMAGDGALNDPTTWTPDSRAILFTSNRYGHNGLFKQGIGEEGSEPVYTGAQDIYYVHVSPDGTWILMLEMPETPGGPNRLLRIAVNGGVPQFVLVTQNGLDFRCASAPARLCVVFESSQDKKHIVITAFDPVKGRGKVLKTVAVDSPYYRVALSPDGSTVALSKGEDAEIGIRFVSLSSGGLDREIKVKGWPNISGIDWAIDGKGLYCGSTDGTKALLSVDLNGHAQVLWQSKGKGGVIWGFPSPDGHYLAMMSYGLSENVWTVDGF